MTRGKCSDCEKNDPANDGSSIQIAYHLIAENGIGIATDSRKLLKPRN